MPQIGHGQAAQRVRPRKPRLQLPGIGVAESHYAALAERYRTELPRLAMGAWNRIGDLAYRANEWAKAKDAYRTVLDKFPPLVTPTAAARFALAEILYREERYAEATALYEKQMAGLAEGSAAL